MRVDDRGLVKELESLRREHAHLLESVDGIQNQLNITKEDLKAALDRVQDTDQQLKDAREELKELQKKLLQVEQEAAKEREECAAKVAEATRRTVLAETQLDTLKEESKIAVDVDPSVVVNASDVDASVVESHNDSGIESCVEALNIDFEAIFSHANLSGFDSALFDEFQSQ